MAVNDNEYIDSLLQKLLSFKPKANDVRLVLTEDEIWYLLDRIISELQKGSALLEVDPPLTICGDTHGQYNDVKRLFKYCGWPPTMRYLFLGDYIDRGPQSIETMSLMFAFKIRFPNDFFILRGNHETAPINRVYGFYDECKQKYSVRLWKHFQVAFDSMPVAGLVANRMFCMHGGLSPIFDRFDQLRKLKLPFEIPERGGLLCDLVWADPSVGTSGFIPSSRGVSYTFGEDVVINFCQKYNMDLICRAHQVVADGYEFFANRKLVTLFSAPNYCGEFDNKAGMLFVDANLTCKLRQLKPDNRKNRSMSRRSMSMSSSSSSSLNK